jgi:hypothetical protein
VAAINPLVEDPLFVGEILRDIKSNKPYVVKQRVPNYWGDGATGYQLAKRSYGEELLPFWVRPEELASIYRRYADRPMFPV